MKLIIGSLSHTILLIVNSVSIADDFITRTRQWRHFNNDNCLQILLCQYCVFQCAPTHIHTQSHTYMYKWTMSYKNLHIPCFAIFIFSAASLRSINSIFEHKSALDMLYWLYPWQLLRTSPTKNRCLQWESQTICLKYAVTFCIISFLTINQPFSIIMGYAFILKIFTYTYLYNINATPDGLFQFHDRNDAMILVQSNKHAASQ